MKNAVSMRRAIVRMMKAIDTELVLFMMPEISEMKRGISQAREKMRVRIT
jgi:hypothetical protein